MRHGRAVGLLGSPQRLLYCLFLIYTSALAAVAQAKTVHEKWDISYQFAYPDCVGKLAVTINGYTHGPTIRAVQGDTVVVTVKNSLLAENVAIHWHGIRQIGTPWADGTEGLTQCPIFPGDTFEYTFVVDRPGTYMYHVHYGTQLSAGLNGMIVVAVPPGAGPDLAEPHEVSLNDYEQATGLASVPLVWVDEPQSRLINAPQSCNATHPECSTPVFAVVPGKTYQFRIGSITSLSALNFEIKGHPMTVVKRNGHCVEPFVVKNLDIYSGETYSVLINADQYLSRNSGPDSNMVSHEPSTPTGTTVLVPPPPAPPSRAEWNDTAHRINNQSLAALAHPYHDHQPLLQDHLQGQLIPPLILLQEYLNAQLARLMLLLLSLLQNKLQVLLLLLQTMLLDQLTRLMLLLLDQLGRLFQLLLQRLLG